MSVQNPKPENLVQRLCLEKYENITSRDLCPEKSENITSRDLCPKNMKISRPETYVQTSSQS